MPAIILVEMLAQVGGLAAAAPADGDPVEPLRLRVAGFGPFKFPCGREAGRMARGARPRRRHARVIIKIEGEVTADGEVVAIGAVTLAGPREGASAEPARSDG